ncbi:hypothetical protein DXG01_003494 [Tephrocybe rancida]|nr:hypothetical protein DXG01_003494 [Tephrocybe rancida]
MHYRAPSRSNVLSSQSSGNIRRRSSSLLNAGSTHEERVVMSNSLSTINDYDTQSTASLLPNDVPLQDHAAEYPPHTSNADLSEPEIPVCSSFMSKTSPTSSACASSTVTRPQGIHTRSKHSFCTIWSGISVDSGHKSLIRSVGTTAKFTNKWPAPASLRKINLHAGGLNEAMDLELSQAIVAVIEAGESLSEDKQKWTQHKWCLLLSVFTVFAYGSVGLSCAVKTWFRGWDQADVLRVVDNDILIVITLTAAMLLFISIVGICGVFLDSRPILALYALLLWPGLMSIAAIGYTSYHRVTYALDHKMNLSWSRYLTPLGRLLVQDALHCCGYSSPLHSATLSSRCYPRSPLPGCKSALVRFERVNLATIWAAAFSIAILHLCNIVISLLCANHLTNTFGKGITPKQYRLSAQDVKGDADRILVGLKAKVNTLLNGPNVLY